ncbi:putative UDP-glucuronate:xylan alpha-glucuronosyltransferase 5 [Tanacetum coccineum]
MHNLKPAFKNYDALYLLAYVVVRGMASVRTTYIFRGIDKKMLQQDLYDQIVDALFLRYSLQQKGVTTHHLSPATTVKPPPSPPTTTIKPPPPPIGGGLTVVVGGYGGGGLMGEKVGRLMSSTYKSREAYATVLHSSETYVCGAIALAQSILQTNSTKDLILLADASISSKSIRGLKAAGWKIKLIERIRSPHAKKGAYNEYNYSKLRIWQLTEYDKVIFIDADLIVLKKLDKFFSYPQLSAVGNDKYLFNSGLILIEPSQCMFNGLMEKISTLGSYNGGDQGFLNEAFTWWHRFHSKLNHLKIFHNTKDNRHDIMDGLYTIHYLGLKPWLCYKDYDCNWDMLDRRRFASDSAHKKWWKVYETMNSKLRPFCGLTKQMDARIRKWRRIAKSSGFKDEHWKIKVLTLGALHQVHSAALQCAASAWHTELGSLCKPLLVVNIGGPIRHCRYGADLARQLTISLMNILPTYGTTPPS